MNAHEKSWGQNEEEYLKYAYTALRADLEPVPLNQAVERWEFLSDDTSKSYFWRALEIFQKAGKLNVEEDRDGTRLFGVEPVEMDEVKQVEKEMEFEVTEKYRVSRKAGEGGSLDHRDYEGSKFARVPIEIAEEHFERHGFETSKIKSDGLEGMVASDETNDGTKKSWFGVYNDLDNNEDHVWMKQIFKGFEMEEGSIEDIFTGQNRESYADKRWEDEILTIRQRSNYIWDSAIEAVEEVLPENVKEYNKKVGKYDDAYQEEIDEIEALRRQYRLMVGDETFKEEKDYPSEIAEGYYEGDIRDLEILRPFSDRVETGRGYEGDMPLGEAIRGSKTSEGKKQRNQVYLSQYLEWVSGLADARYD